MRCDTPTWRMADRLAGGKLDTIVAKKLEQEWSWERISRHLHVEYGIEVSRVTLANWYGTSDPNEAA